MFPFVGGRPPAEFRFIEPLLFTATTSPALATPEFSTTSLVLPGDEASKGAADCAPDLSQGFGGELLPAAITNEIQ